MKIMERNKQSFYYCLYSGKTAVVDAEGNETGESSLTYSTEVLMKANVSAATGYAQIEQFGSNEQYDSTECANICDWWDVGFFQYLRQSR